MEQPSAKIGHVWLAVFVTGLVIVPRVENSVWSTSCYTQSPPLCLCKKYVVFSILGKDAAPCDVLMKHQSVWSSMVNIGYFYLTFGKESCGLLPEKFSGLHSGTFKIATQVESYLVTEYVVANMSFFCVTFVSIVTAFKLLLCTWWDISLPGSCFFSLPLPLRVWIALQQREQVKTFTSGIVGPLSTHSVFQSEGCCAKIACGLCFAKLLRVLLALDSAERSQCKCTFTSMHLY